MKIRSPVLGFNHNVKHRGRLFHVQTEDSGIKNPHVFTHLFHGGTIIQTRKLDYDPALAELEVKGLMQAQHKMVLRELKRGQHDAKIIEYLGPHPESGEPEAAAESAEAAPEAHAVPFEPAAAPPPAPPAPPPTTALDDAIPVAVSFTSAGTGRLPAAQSPDRTERVPAPTTGRHPVQSPPRTTGPLSPIVPPPTEPERRGGDQHPTPSSVYINARKGQREEPFRSTGEVPIPRRPATIPPGDPRRATAPAGSQPNALDQTRSPGSGPVVRSNPVAVPSRSAALTPSSIPAARPFSPPSTLPRPPSGAPGARHSTPSAMPASTRQGTPGSLPRPPLPASVTPGSIPAAPRLPPARHPTPGQIPGAQPSAATRSGQLPRSQPPSGVVVARPAMMVGGGRKPAAPTPPAPARESKPGAPDTGIFGQGLISERSLDEVILAYLSEDTPEE